MSGFAEVADRVWVARYRSYDVNVTVVEGEAGLLVVDTRASDEEGRALVEDLRRLSSRPVLAVVNTHAHHDHHLGNAALREAHAGLRVTAHEGAAEEVAADAAFSSVSAIDLGDRAVELVHPGRGHTGGDLVVRVEDADVVLAGDLVEESGHPAFGDDCFPLEWPTSLDLVLQLIGPDTVVVPGHGAPVGRDFVQEQRSAIGVVAETIRHAAGQGLGVEDALAQSDWPYPREVLADAVRRGFEQLPRSARRLPLI